MSSYENIYDVLNSVSNGMYIGDHLDDLSVDQRIAAAQVIALTAIAEELHLIAQHGIAHAEASPPEEPGVTFGM